jgi:hypothetical protein
MTNLDALDLATAALRECQALRKDPEEKALLSRAHDRIQHLRDLEMRHGTPFVADQETNSEPGNARIVPADPPTLKFAVPVVKPELSH